MVKEAVSKKKRKVLSLGQQVIESYVESAHCHFQEHFMLQWTRMIENEKHFSRKLEFITQQLRLQRDFGSFLMKFQSLYKEKK